MRAAFFTALLALAGTALASPAVARAKTPGCADFAYGVANVARFTLAAAPADQLPLGALTPLALVAQTPSLLESFIVVSNASTEFTMVDSGISVLATDGSTGAVSQNVSTTNGFLQFVSFTSLAPTPAYCELTDVVPNKRSNPSPTSVLAVNGNSHEFYICERRGTFGAGAQRVVVYNPQPGAGAFTFSTCSHVDIFVIQS